MNRKIAFFHDHFFLEKNGVYYSKGGLPASVWERYLTYFDEMLVFGRCSRVKSNFNRLSKSSHPQVKFHLLPNLCSFNNRRENRKISQNVILDSLHNIDFAVVRLPSEIGYLAIDILTDHNIPYVVEVVDCPFDAHWYHRSFLRKLYSLYALNKMKKYVYNAKNVIYVTKEFLQSRYPCSSLNTTNISNVEIPFVYDELIEQKIKQIQSNFDRKVVRLGVIGNLDNNLKGIDVAIEVVSKLNSNLNADFYLSIVGSGDGKCYQALTKHLGQTSKVIFEGVLESGEGVFNWMDTIDIFIIPSLKEGLPRALIEAMSRGCLCLGSNIAGIPELLSTNDLFSKRSSDECMEIIEKYISGAYSLKDSIESNIINARCYTKDKLERRRNDFILECLSDTDG